MRILFEGTYKECLEKENKLRPHPGIGWNEFNGGNRNLKASERLKKRLSQSQKGRKITWGDKISKTMTGRKIGPPSKEHRKHLSQALKGSAKVSINAKRNWRNWRKTGYDIILRKKISDAAKLRWKIWKEFPRSRPQLWRDIYAEASQARSQS